MKTIIYLTVVLALISCSDKEKEAQTEGSNQTVAEVSPDDLVQVRDGVFYEYYPDGKSIKFTGPQDAEGNRHGKWLYYSQDGRELSMTMYKNGLKHGHSIVKYPDGTVHYYGEYKEDKKVGVWKSYNDRGKLETEIDYDQIK